VPWDDVDALGEAVAGADVAAVLLEPIQGEGGIRTPSPGYLAEVRRLCDRHGILLMIDEVQTGLGRTGRWFGFQHAGVEPDVVTVAKALGNGVPIGACWAKAGVAGAFRPGDHATTYGGQPLATAAAEAVLAELERIDAPARARAAGARLSAGLAALPGVVGVRGMGLLLAAELDPSLDAGTVAGSALSAGLVVNAVTTSALRLAPPLTVTDDEIDEALAILEGVLS
jgi:acetylornithine/succinyldiaminopimelate/putrescine aminotransferase